MAQKKKTLKIRETKEVVFDILKAAAPTLFLDKEYTDVENFGEAEDNSYLEIEFKEEAG